MSLTIDPSRLNGLRKRRDLSRDALGRKAKVNKQTIYRIEAGHQQAVRTSTVKKLADALAVRPEVLTGQAPLPEPASEPARARPSDSDDYSINVPVDGAIRNAFSLAAMRYNVPIARIVELAPFLFVLAAEASLEWRKSKHGEFQKALKQAQDSVPDLPYLRASLSLLGDSFIGAETRSISAGDIFGNKVPDSDFNMAGLEEETMENVEPGYRENVRNPFVVYLKEVAPARSDVASINNFDRSSSDFCVCYEDALKLADGADDKEDLASSIVNGEVILHKIPRELLNDDAADERIAWLREKRDAHRAHIDLLHKSADEAMKEMMDLLEEAAP